MAQNFEWLDRKRDRGLYPAPPVYPVQYCSAITEALLIMNVRAHFMYAFDVAFAKELSLIKYSMY